MRWLCVLAIATALAPWSTAEAQPLTGWGVYRFGMSVDEAIAADPAMRRPYAQHGNVDTLRRDGPIWIGDFGYFPTVTFEGNALDRILFTSAGPVDHPAACRDYFMRALGAFEPEHGALSGGPSIGEYGAPLAVNATAGGSSVRTYAYGDAGGLVFFSNRRVGAGSIEARGRGWAHPSAPAGRLGCEIEVELRDQAHPELPNVPPPTAEELANAPPLTSPRWLRRHVSADVEVAIPEMPPQAINVVVDLDCLVIAGGAINCAILRESPSGMNFGEMARRINLLERVAETDEAGSTVGRRLSSPFRMTLNDPSSSAPAPTASINLEELRALAAAAPSQAELEAAPRLTGAGWVGRPDAEDFSTHYPAAALAAGVGGRVVLDCIIRADFQPRCAIATEEPIGYEFGLAALGIAQSFRAPAESNGESSVGRRVRIPITFSLG